MIQIIRPGKYLSFSINKQKYTLKCEECECEFSCLDSDTTTGGAARWVCCPCCGHIIYIEKPED